MANTLPVQSTITQEPIAPALPAPVIQIGQMEAIIGIVVFLVGLGVSWGTLKTKLGHVADTLKDKIEPDLKDVREKLTIVKDRVEALSG